MSIREDLRWKAFRRLSNRLANQEALIAELYYAWDIRSVRSRIRRFMEHSEVLTDQHQRKVARRRLAQ